MPTDPQVLMLDQLWRVIAGTALQATVMALCVAPVAYAVLRLALRGRP